MVSSAVYPGLERKPGGPDNWVERAGGLPKYIERIAKHLHYERGYTISRAIATAVNTVKRWAKGGTVTKHGTTKRVSPKTIAQAAAAVASWTAKKAAGKLNLSDDLFLLIDLSEVSEWEAFDLLDLVQDGAENGRCATLAAGDIDLAKELMKIEDLATRANAVADPEKRSAARLAVLDLAIGGSGDQFLIDLASTIAPRNARGKAKDGRNSFKGQGKWKHGFVPVNTAAKEAKSKGSPIAMKRMRRLFGKDKVKDDARKNTREVQSSKAATGRSGQRGAKGRKSNPTQVNVAEKSQPGSERAKDIAHLRKTKFEDNRKTPDSKLKESQKEASKASRIPERAKQNWNEIPDSLKTVRNGKRYVLAEFGGKQYVTEWLGGVSRQESAPLAQRKVMRTLSSADAKSMPQSALRALISNPRTPASVKVTARQALRKQAQEAS